VFRHNAAGRRIGEQDRAVMTPAAADCVDVN